MVYNMSELFAADGTATEMEVRPEFKTFDLEELSYPLSGDNVMKLYLTHTGGRRVRVRGEGKVRLIMPCDRCMKDVPVDVPVDFEREIDANVTEQERIDDLDEQPYIDGYTLDLDGLVRNELILNLPMKVLCKKNCKGICPKCGQDLNEGECGCDKVGLDPRMAVILDLFQGRGEDQ